MSLNDAPQIQLLINDWEVVKWLSDAIPWPYPANGAEEYLSRTLSEIAEGGRYVWAITLKSDEESKLIGVIDLFPNNPNDHRGFWLASRFHGKGFMREAIIPVTDFAFEVLQMEFLYLSNAEPNVASHRLKEISGAEIIEITPDCGFVSGRFSSIKWRLTHENWQFAKCKL